jgi:hypothetical protein
MSQEIDRDKQLLKKIARAISNMEKSDMTDCEIKIAKLLEQELYLKEETHLYDDGGNSYGSYVTYKAIE